MMMMKSLVFSLLILATAQAQSVPRNQSVCVASFWTDRHWFEVCRTELCFIFQFESPHVLPSKKLKAEKPRPFRCSSREQLYPGLNGVFFNVLNRVAGQEPEGARPSTRDAYCVYSGPDCTFDDEVSFIGDAVAASGDNNYKFIIGGRVMFMPNRRTVNIVQSAPIFTDSMVLMHRRRTPEHSFDNAWKNVFKPFKRASWLVGIVFLLIQVLVLITYAQCFSGAAQNQPNVVTWLVNGVPGTNPEQKMAWNLLVLGFTVFVTVLITLYELAVAFSIFHRPDPLVTSFNQLASLGLNRFGVVRESASETKFRILVDKESVFNDSTIPWERMESLKTLITALKRKKLDYIFTYELNVKFHLYSQKLCDLISVSPLHLAAVGGWYYATTIESTVRTRIDKILNHLWATEALQEMYKFDEKPLDCGASITQVDYSVLVILLGLTVAPLLVLTVLSMIKARYFPASSCRVQKMDPELERLTVSANTSADMD